MALVTLHFLTQYGDIYKASVKEYVYETDLTLYKQMIYTKDCHRAFTIENDKGYTYRNSLVIFTGFYKDAEYYGKARHGKLPDSIVKLVTITQVQENVNSDYESTANLPDTMIWGAWDYNNHGRIIWSSGETSNEVSKDFYDATTNIRDVCSNATESFKKLAKAIKDTPPSIDWNKCNIGSSSTDSLYVTSNFCDSSNYSAYTLDSLEDSVNEIINKYMNKEKEKENSKMNFKNYFKFGPEYCTNIRFSTYGPAFKSSESNTYLAYDKSTNSWIDVANFVFDFDNAFFAIPVGVDALNEGDYILHNGTWVRISYIETIENTTVINVENPWSKTTYKIIPERSIFGFNYYTKLIGLMDNAFENASAENPFGNPLLFMAMSGDHNFKEMLPLLLMQNTDNNALTSNPLMLMMMFGDK